jgi:hypothetical protein
LETFIDDLLKHPDLEGCTPIFCCENSLGHDSSTLARVVAKYDYHILIAEKGDGVWGWNASDNAKKEQAFEAWRALHSRQVRFMQNWICSSPFDETPTEERRKVVKTKMLEQARRYKEFEHPSSHAAGHPKSGISGILDKDGKKSRTFNDDLMIAFCMGVFLWMKIYMRDVPGFPYWEVFQDDELPGTIPGGRMNDIGDLELERASKRKRVFTHEGYVRAEKRLKGFSLPGRRVHFVS